MLRRSVSVSLRPRDILKLTFLYLANFVQARRLPTQVESALRACTQCRKSPRRGDFPSFVKWVALRAHRTARCGKCHALHAVRTPSSASRRTSFVGWRLHDVERSAAAGSRLASNAFRMLAPVNRQPSFGNWKSQHVRRPASNAGRPPQHAVRTSHPDICLTLPPQTISDVSTFLFLFTIFDKGRQNAERQSRGDRRDGPERGEWENHALARLDQRGRCRR